MSCPAPPVNEILDSLDLQEIQLPVQKRTSGKLTGLCESGPQGFAGANDQARNECPTVGRDLHHVLSRVRAWGREVGDQRTIERSAPHGISEHPQPRRPGLREGLRSQPTQDGPGASTGQSDDGQCTPAWTGGPGHDGIRGQPDQLTLRKRQWGIRISFPSAPEGSDQDEAFTGSGGPFAFTFFRSLAIHQDWGRVARFAVR